MKSSLQRAEPEGVGLDPTSGVLRRAEEIKIVDATPADEGFGTYQLRLPIASGGMATVYLALQRALAGFQRLVALKCIHPELSETRAFREMFIDEARIAARVNHPYVCRVYDFGLADGKYYFIAMEYLQGEPLSQVFQRLAADPELLQVPTHCPTVARIAANLAEGLHAAHVLRDERGAPLEVVHRDVTPHNLFVLHDGTVRVTDFGIARARQRLHHTIGDKLKGKLGYVAPEQLRRRDIDHRVDVWALGVVMWEMLTGRRLFKQQSDVEIALAVLRDPIAPPSALNRRVPPELDAVVMRALTRDRDQRYASARELSRDLERYLSGCGQTVLSDDVAAWLREIVPNSEADAESRLRAALGTAAELERPTEPALAHDASLELHDATPELHHDERFEPSRVVDDAPTRVEGNPFRAETPLAIRRVREADVPLSAVIISILIVLSALCVAVSWHLPSQPAAPKAPVQAQVAR